MNASSIRDSVVQTAPQGHGGVDMQRDMDFVRSILLRIAEAPAPLRMEALLDKDAGPAEREALVYHLKLLIDQAGFVSGIASHSHAGFYWLDLNLTWSGHEFLDNVRDPEIWRQTKAGAVKAGQWSLKALADIAVAIGKARIEQLFSSGSLDL